MANKNETYDDNCDMVKELQDVRKERDAEQPMPHMTTTDKLMRSGTGKEVED